MNFLSGITLVCRNPCYPCFFKKTADSDCCLSAEQIREKENISKSTIFFVLLYYQAVSLYCAASVAASVDAAVVSAAPAAVVVSAGVVPVAASVAVLSSV